MLTHTQTTITYLTWFCITYGSSTCAASSSSAIMEDGRVYTSILQSLRGSCSATVDMVLTRLLHGPAFGCKRSYFVSNKPFCLSSQCGHVHIEQALFVIIMLIIIRIK